MVKFCTLILYCTMTWQGSSPGDGHHMQAGEWQAHESRGGCNRLRHIWLAVRLLVVAARARACDHD